jgi:hypothetical protein
MDTEKQYRRRFDATLSRLKSEVINLRLDLAALTALQESKDVVKTSMLLTLCVGAMRSDILVRLVRIFEEDSKVASFWYLHRCEPTKVSEGVKLARLSDFACRLKGIRDKCFVHIDKDGLFNVAAIYKNAGIRETEINKNVETIWLVLKRLAPEGLSKFHLTATPEQLVEKYRSDLRRLGLKP